MIEFTTVRFLDFEGRSVKFNDTILLKMCKKIFSFSKPTRVARKCNFPSLVAHLQQFEIFIIFFLKN